VRSPKTNREAIRGAAAEVINQILDLKQFNPSGVETISRNDLMELERRQPAGDLEEEAEVLVNRSQPMEEKSEEFATIVNANMRSGVAYRYFFHDLKSMPLIARLVYKIVVCSPDKGAAHLSDDKIRENLGLVAQKMSIHLVPSNGPIEFFVHN